MSAELLGIPAEIEHDRKVFKLGPANQKAKAVLEELLAANAVRNVLSLKEALGSDFQSVFAETTKNISTGQYKTGARGWLDSLITEAGVILFSLSLFRVNHPSMTVDECREIVDAHGDEFTAAMSRVAPGFFSTAFPKMPPEQLADIVEKFKTAFGNAK